MMRKFLLKASIVLLFLVWIMTAKYKSHSYQIIQLEPTSQGQSRDWHPTTTTVRSVDENRPCRHVNNDPRDDQQDIDGWNTTHPTDQIK